MRPVSEMTPVEAARIRFVLFDIDDTITTAGKLTAEAYSAMWALSGAGLRLIPVTGRPAGWCDLIIREWPVCAVIGENGAFALHSLQGGRPETHTHPNAPADAQARLAAVREAVLAAVPGCRVARDQFCRKYDLAIDFCEDEPRLPLSAAEEIRRVCTAHGAHAKVSSIHVNAWFGDYDKRSMTELLFRTALREDPFAHSIFFGDSPNDEPMFEAFPLACAVANIAPFAGRMAHLPPYAASLPGGAGFAEAAAHILAQRGRA